jgi:flagellar FliJ protein
MPFRFSLAAVLKYREELEKREERILEQRREVLARLEAQLAELKEQRLRWVAERTSLLERGILGDDLHYATEQIQRLDELEKEICRQAAAAMLDYEAQMKVFLVTRQKREILDELKSTQKDSYNALQDRREQQQIDEIFIARMNRES